MRKHYVTFLSPGTFFSETSTKPIAEWSTREAVKLAEKIVERHTAKPYGFYFTTTLSAAPVPDGEGGMLDVKEKEVAHSSRYFLGGKLLTVDDVRRRADPKDHALLFNMETNDFSIVVENTNSWKTTMPFGEQDFIVDAAGEIVQRGDEPEWVAYRAEKKAEHMKRLGL